MSVKSALPREFSYLARKVRIHPSDLPGYICRSWKFAQAQRRLVAASRSLEGQDGYIAHFGVHLTGDNAGDVVLYDSVQRLFKKFLEDCNFRSLPLREEVSTELVQELNHSAKCIVVGGGGLIFPVEANRSQSGWQWNISQSTLEQVTIPLILFAVGVNSFRGQEGFSSIAIRNLATVGEKAAFIGMRNHGSIQKLQSLVPQIDRAKIAWQPCMTTVLDQFTKLPAKAVRSQKTVAVNVAVDRSELRFQGKENEVFDSLADACGKLSAEGHRLVIVTHSEKDDSILPFMKKRKVQFSVKRLERCEPSEVTDFYSQVDLTIGMRGHAQMIPFGCGNAILSVKSHDKLGFFLDDIGHPEWGVEALEPGLAGRTFDVAQRILSNLDEVLAQVREAKQKLWNQTESNMHRIQSVLAKMER